MPLIGQCSKSPGRKLRTPHPPTASLIAMFLSERLQRKKEFRHISSRSHNAGMTLLDSSVATIIQQSPPCTLSCTHLARKVLNTRENLAQSGLTLTTPSD